MASANSTNQPGLFDAHAQKKRCTQCDGIKPMSDFYVNKKMRCGRMSECKECTKRMGRRTAYKQKASAEGVIGKPCSKCGETKLLEQFGKSRQCKFGRSPRCKECTAAEASAKHAQQKACPEYRRKRQEFDRIQGMKRYGVSPEQYAEMHASQGGLCAICGEPEMARVNHTRQVRRLCIDHDHSTGKIRSLLCSRCNHGIGNFRDDPKRLAAAIAYLQRHAN